MSININVKADITQVQRFLDKEGRKAVNKAATRSLNRTVKQVNASAAKRISKIIGLKVKDVKDKLIIFKASHRKLTAVIEATGKAMNLIRFGAKQVKKGVSAKAWGKRKVYKGAFIANKGKTVFKRTSSNRLPIKPVYGPDIPHTFIDEEVQKEMETTANKRWPINFSQDLKYYLSRIK